MKKGLLVFSIFCFLFGALIGCEKLGFLNPKSKKTVENAQPLVTPAAKGAVVAKINNTVIDLNDLNEDVSSFNAVVPADKQEMKITTNEQKIKYLKTELLRRTLLYQEALKRGIDKNEEISKAMEKTKQDLLVMELVREETEKIKASSKEVEAWYNTNKEQLKEPEERQIREIMVPTEQEARDIMILLLQGADFAALAKERSKSASAKNGGDLGNIQRGKKTAQFDAVAFSDSLEIGKISSIFKGADGYYMLKVEAKRGGQQKPLSEIWNDVERGLTLMMQQQKVEELIGKLFHDAKIEWNEGEVK